MAKEIKKRDINLRYNIMTIFTYIIGVALIIQLFNLQIIHGSEYRERSNTRLTRESVIEAARGSISDRTGELLVTSDEKFKLELYKSKMDNEKLNETILNIVNLLEKYQVNYVDFFPIKIEPFEFTISDSNLIIWKENNKFDENITAEDAFYYYKNKYEIKNEDVREIRKILSIRYAITKEGYSSTKALTISEKIPREAVSEFSERSEEFSSVNITVEPVRKYTQGTLASHILGYVSQISQDEYEEKKDTYTQNDIIGKTGIESVFEKYLKGKNGVKQIDMAVNGTVTAEITEEEAIAGADISLTIDSKLQKVTEEALAANIEKIKSGGFAQAYDAKGGSCVVMNVKTGEILALASYPTYNPESFVNGISTEEWNGYLNNDSHPLINKTIQSSYAPGSIFKMVTAVAGLESGVITTTERINDTGVYSKYNMTWPCWYYTDYHRGHGLLNVSSAIQHSCNFFFYETGDRMGIEELDKYATYFGLGKKTGVELPGEKSGILASKETARDAGITWGPGQVINAAIGQGLNEFTPLQMTKYISMLANGGKNIDVSIIKSITYQDGNQVSKEEIKSYINEKLRISQDTIENLNINQENLNAVLEGMKSVTYESGGTAYNIFKGFNIEVGGKTGSAEAANNYVNAWFAGFAPYDDPEIAVVVMVENGGHGNYTAEAVRDIMAEYFGMNTNNVSEDMTAIPYTESMR